MDQEDLKTEAQKSGHKHSGRLEAAGRLETVNTFNSIVTVSIIVLLIY